MKFTCARSAENSDCVLAGEESRFSLITGELRPFFVSFSYRFQCRSVMITFIRGSIHQGREAFSEHSRGRKCAFMSLTALLFG